MKSEITNQTNQSSDLLNINQTSELLNLTVSQLRSLIFKKQIPVLKLGGCVRFSKEDLKAWLDQKRTKPKSI